MGKIINKKPKVFVMMSGGVDSSVAAFLLKKSGKYEVLGAFIRGYNVDGCQEKDAADARRVAQYLGIPFYTIDLEKDYKKMVVDYMIAGYKKGITPNPDIMCNKEIKFGLFLKKALELGADFVATGHYTRIKREFPISNFQFPNKSKRLNSRIKEVYKLYQAKDKNKDQSYFLWTLNQSQLKHCLFPIGDYLKSEVRSIAKKAGLPTAGKKDSQGICFLGQVNIRDFLKQFLPIKKGAILTADGIKIGTHDGVWFYTIGQRHLGVNLKFPASQPKNSQNEKKPFYVANKDVKKNILIVAEGDDNQELYKKEIGLTDINFINNDWRLAIGDLPFLVRVRYRQPLVPAILSCRSLVVGCRLEFLHPQKFIASGQSAVLYKKTGEMIGGGIIK